MSAPMVFTCSNCGASYAVDMDGTPTERPDPDTGEIVLLANLDVIDLRAYELWKTSHVGPFLAPVPGS